MTVKECSSSKFPSCYSSDLKSVILQKKIAHKKWHEDYQIFKHPRSQIKFLINECYKDYTQNFENTLSNICLNIFENSWILLTDFNFPSVWHLMMAQKKVFNC